MDPGSLERLRARFGAAIDELAAVVPDDCYLLRWEDAWVRAPHQEGSRVRAADFARATDGPTLAELQQRAGGLARAAGWRPIDQQDGTDVFRIVDKTADKAAPRYLRVGPTRIAAGDAALPVLRIDLERGAPWHDAEPAFARDAVTVLLRERWGLAGAVDELRVETYYDPAELGTPRAIRGEARLPSQQALLAAIMRHGMRQDGPGRWTKTERWRKGALTLEVEVGGGVATVRVDHHS